MVFRINGWALGSNPLTQPKILGKGPWDQPSTQLTLAGLGFRVGFGARRPICSADWALNTLQSLDTDRNDNGAR